MPKLDIPFSPEEEAIIAEIARVNENIAKWVRDLLNSLRGHLVEEGRTSSELLVIQLAFTDLFRQMLKRSGIEGQKATSLYHRMDKELNQLAISIKKARDSVREEVQAVH